MINKTLLLIALLGLSALLYACPRGADDATTDSVSNGQTPAAGNPCADQADPAELTDDEAEPTEQADGEETMPEADDAALADNPCGEDMMSTEEAIRYPVEVMAEAMRDYYGAGFRACFHPDSPAVEAQVENYNAWKKLNQHVEISKLDIVERTEGLALLEYEFVYTQRPGNTEVKRETGSIEVVQNDEGKWMIMEIVQH